MESFAVGCWNNFVVYREICMVVFGTELFKYTINKKVSIFFVMSKFMALVDTKVMFWRLLT